LSFHYAKMRGQATLPNLRDYRLLCYVDRLEAAKFSEDDRLAISQGQEGWLARALFVRSPSQ